MRDRLGLGETSKKPPTGTGQCRRSLKPNRRPREASLLYDPKLRAIVYQVVLAVVVVFLFYTAATNAVANLRRGAHRLRLRLPLNTAGFDISQTLIPFSAAGSTYGDAFLVGLLNTLLVAAIGIFFATFLGFVVGIARLSKNWIVAKVAMVYVEVIRNIPLLLQLLFWYIAVLTSLPQPAPVARTSAPASSSTQRGLFMPKPIWRADAWLIRVDVHRRPRRARSRSASGQGGSRSRPGGSIRSG